MLKLVGFLINKQILEWDIYMFFPLRLDVIWKNTHNSTRGAGVSPYDIIRAIQKFWNRPLTHIFSVKKGAHFEKYEPLKNSLVDPLLQLQIICWYWHYSNIVVHPWAL